MGSQKWEVESKKWEVGGQKSNHAALSLNGQKSEIRSSNFDKSEVWSLKNEVLSPKCEVWSRKSEDPPRLSYSSDKDKPMLMRQKM